MTNLVGENYAGIVVDKGICVGHVSPSRESKGAWSELYWYDDELISVIFSDPVDAWIVDGEKINIKDIARYTETKEDTENKLYDILVQKNKIDENVMIFYLKSKFNDLDGAKKWLINWANNDCQIIKDGEYSGKIFTINLIIKYISSALGDPVDNAFESSFYWDLRDYYETNI